MVTRPRLRARGRAVRHSGGMTNPKKRGRAPEPPPEQAGRRVPGPADLLSAAQAAVVEQHIFGGMNFAEIAELLAISEQTVKRDLSAAKALLAVWLGAAG